MKQLPAEQETNPAIPEENRFDKVITKLSQSVGISHMTAANLLSQALKGSIPITNTTPAPEWDYIAALLSSLEPQNIQEAMLAIQMLSVHYRAAEYFSKAVKNDFLTEQHLKMAMKLSRLFASQLETLKKIRSKGEQRMIVEHVHVHSGGQAIVGNIESDKV